MLDKLGAWTFDGADVLSPGHRKLETVQLFGGKAQILARTKRSVGRRHLVTMPKPLLISLSMRQV